MAKRNVAGMQLVVRGLALVLLAIQLGCTSSNAPAGGSHPHDLLLKPPPGGFAHSPATVLSLKLGQGFKVALPPTAQAALGQLAAPALPASAHSSKRASAVPLPVNVGGDYPYDGDAGYIANSADVTFPGFPDGANMAPTGATYPDNFSYILYRLNGLPGIPGMLTFDMGLAGPTDQFGVCAYNWAYGSGGRWEPIYYGLVDNIQVQLTSYTYTNFRNVDGDLALLVFCLNPSTVSVNSFTFEEAEYDEVEPNNDPFGGETGALPLFPFALFFGNVGEGGPLDGETGQDWFTLDAAPGDTLTFSAQYGNPNVPDGDFLLGLVDQAWLDGGGQDPPLALGPGTGGSALLNYAVTGLESFPLYLIVQDADFEAPTPPPPTDYSLDGTNGQTPLYNELEKNDKPQYGDYLEELDSMNAVIWTGNLGTDGVTPGYDGDLDDWSGFADPSFPLSPGEMVSLNLAYNQMTGNFGLTLYDGSGFVLDHSEDGDGSEDINYMANGSEPQPLFIEIDGSGYGDYTLTGTR